MKAIEMTNQQEWNIRPGRLADVERLVAFSQAMALETEGRRLDTDRLQRGTRALLNSTIHGFFLVAEHIGQACEFDYSGTQACKALRNLGYEIILVNSNPATIMTDPGMADVTYIEPLTVESLTRIIEKEKPDAILPNLGGQTGLNLSAELSRRGILDAHGVKIIGVQADAIERGEDRIAFKATMNKLGIEMPQSEPAFSVEEAEEIVSKLGFPVVIRPAYTLVGTGGGLVYKLEELRTVASRGISATYRADTH